MVQPTCNRTGGVNVSAVVTPRRSFETIADSESATRGTIKSREWQSALISHDATYPPTAEKLIVEEAILGYRNIVRVADYQPMRAVKVAGRSAGQR